MSARREQKRPRLSLEELERIDEVGTRFDRALRNGAQLSIEELLIGFEGHVRNQLLLDLLLVDLEFRSPFDLQRAAADYLSRFPANRGVVHKAIEKHRELHDPETATASLITFAPAESPQHDTTLTLGKVPALIPLRLRYLEDYELLTVLGRGGMGIVYHARQRLTGQDVAIKMLLAGENSTEDQIKRFLREAQTASKLQHPNIVAVREIGYCNGAPYFVMDYVDGTDLESLLNASQITQMEAALLIKTAATAIQYAHNQNVVHRDVKPSNLLLDQDTRLRITDFGLAKALSPGDTLTLSGDVLGTPAYMPPEQALADRDLIGPRSDIYSLGAVLFFLLTGRPPFEGDAVVKVLHQVVTARPPNPRSLDRSISEGLATICLKCLEKNPQQRYQSAADLADDLNRWQRLKPLQAQQPALQSLERKITPKARSVTSKWVTLITALACLLIAGILMIPGSRQQPLSLKAVEVATDRAISVPIVPPRPESPKQFVWEGLEYLEGQSFAYADRPFGIGRISFQVNAGSSGGWKWYRDQPARVSSDSCRVQYQSFEFVESSRRAGRDSFTVWFLIQELQPGELRVNLDFDLPEDVRLPAGETQPVRNLKLTVKNPDGDFRKAVRTEWWTAMQTNRLQKPLTPSADLQVVNDYFLNMLQRRWNPFLPAEEQLQLTEFPDADSDIKLERQFEEIVSLLLGFESIRLAMMDVTPFKNDAADIIEISDVQALELEDPFPVNGERFSDPERLAFHVPEECFYLRCGSVDRYLWVRDVVQGWGGSLDEIVAVPAVDYRIRDRIERQLAFFPNMARADGIDEKLEDCALIGLDPHFREGAAVGILFQAKPGESENLSTILAAQRKLVKEENDALEQLRPIGEESFPRLSTEHYRINSYYVTKGEFHLITNSRKLATRFVQTFEDGAKSLGTLFEYRLLHDRHLQHVNSPTLYVPTPFIRNITSPAWVIEVERRRQAVRELQLLGLAAAAAHAEQIEFHSWRDLKRKGFLGADFGKWPDSRDYPVLTSVHDSLRGYPGMFLPIADHSISHVTSAEQKAYERFTKAYKEQWTTAQPVLLTFASEKDEIRDINKVVIDIRLTPFASRNYNRLVELLPPRPGRDRLKMLTHELLGISVNTQDEQSSAQFHLGLVDVIEDIDWDIHNGEIRRHGKFEETQFADNNYYFLASPLGLGTMGLAQKLGRALGMEELLPQADQLSPQNAAQSRQGIIVAIDDDVRTTVKDQVDRKQHLDRAAHPAHLWLGMGDVRNSRVIDYFRAVTYITGRQTSAADAAVLNRMSADLRLFPKEAKSRLEEILGGEELETEEELGGSRMTQLQCPAGGVYVLDDQRIPRYWRSTGWQEKSLFEESSYPQRYEYPFLNWVKELSLESTFESDPSTLESHLELTLRDPPEPIGPGPDGGDPDDGGMDDDTNNDNTDKDNTDKEDTGKDDTDAPMVSVLKIENGEEKDLFEYRYRKHFGTWIEWKTLDPGEPADCPLEQSLEVEYRFTGRTRRLLVGAEAHLRFTKHGWNQVR